MRVKILDEMKNGDKVYMYLIQHENGDKTTISAKLLAQHVESGKFEIDGMVKEKQVERKAVRLEPVTNPTPKLIPSIFGVQIKNIKIGHGREGEYYYGNVYYMGKKLGEWSQDAGGCIVDNFDFDTGILKDSLDKYRIYVSKPDLSIEMFMVKIIEISEYYKLYKKMLKENKYTHMTVVQDSYGMRYVTLKHNGLNLHVNAAIQKHRNEIEKEGFGVEVKHFYSDLCFIIQ